ncbi:hypothetical protein PL75_01175 [Neisseria arctica]|uniref:Conjugal transfer protein TraH n=1 Tax=Neisseria arctica TaxID=1470200 RepID=A0A0J1C5J5_9NEIS|nr:conjugal transfer protein TraH [Neisseria arctica]KLT73593.1 hypothetical protein PL75_01175 [Neisseria arctica]UOO85713.1 conjugal transfer protein TraH [Neisseria arctica]
MKFKYSFFTKPAKVLAISLCLIQPLTSQAALEQEMAGMFNSMGVETNYTEAGAFHGQAGSLYSGGSFSARTSVSDIQLASTQLPSINAGCGGIDIFGGAFSFVNKEQFIQFVRNLGNNAAGVAFDLALKALDPMIQDAIGGIRDLVNQINRSNLNSCESSKLLVGGIANQIGMSMAKNCQATHLASGSADDYSDAGWMCRTGENIVRAADEVRGKNTPEDTISFVGGNLLYAALSQAGVTDDLDEEDLMLYFSLAGTAIFQPPKTVSTNENSKQNTASGVQDVAPTIVHVGDLLGGKNKAPLSSKYINIDMNKCVNGPKKLRENCFIQKDVQVKSIRYDINEIFTKLVSKLNTDQGWTEDEKKTLAKYVNSTKLPILRMAVSDALTGSRYLAKEAVIDAVAVDYVAYILDRSERVMRRAMGFYTKLDESAQGRADRIYENMNKLRQTIYAEKRDAMRNIESEEAFMQMQKQFESQWRAANFDTGSSIDFDTQNRL